MLRHIDVVHTSNMCSNTDHLEWHLDVYWRCVLRQCAATLITLNDILMSIGGVYYVNVQQHWSPSMRPWCLLEVCTTSMCSNTDHLVLYLDAYWKCVLHQCAGTLITLNDILISIGGVYYVNVQEHWSPWMTSWCLLDVCTTSICSNIDHLEWYLDFYCRCSHSRWSILLHIDVVHTSNRHQDVIQGDKCYCTLT
jgi:metal-sulfur cluster biosynthetic enzyme